MPEPTQPALTNSQALWTALQRLHLPWAEPAEEEMLAVTPEITLQLYVAEGELEYAWAFLYASESFWDLLAGEGDYTLEELDDPYSVMEERYDQASGLMGRYQQEAGAVFGTPEEYGEEFTPRAAWHLPHLTLCLEVTQEDKECPVELRLTLLPPGQLPDDWR